MEGETSQEERTASASEEDAGELSCKSITESLASISQASFATRVRLLEITEERKHAESDSRALDVKIGSLLERKRENVELRDELTARNEVNAVSRKSLFQTQSKLFDYRCRVKTEYIEAEERGKCKARQREEILAAYGAEWSATEKQLESLPLSAELSAQRRVNASLRDEIAARRKNLQQLRNDLSKRLEALRDELRNKIVGLAEALGHESKMAGLDHDIREKKSRIRHVAAEESTALEGGGGGGGGNAAAPIAAEEWLVDLAALDDIRVPLECLESRSGKIVAETQNPPAAAAAAAAEAESSPYWPPGSEPEHPLNAARASSKRKSSREKKAEIAKRKRATSGDEPPKSATASQESFFVARSTSTRKTGNADSIFTFF